MIERVIISMLSIGILERDLPSCDGQRHRVHRVLVSDECQVLRTRPGVPNPARTIVASGGTSVAVVKL